MCRYCSIFCQLLVILISPLPPSVSLSLCLSVCLSLSLSLPIITHTYSLCGQLTNVSFLTPSTCIILASIVGSSVALSNFTTLLCVSGRSSCILTCHAERMGKQGRAITNVLEWVTVEGGTDDLSLFTSSLKASHSGCALPLKDAVAH